MWCLVQGHCHVYVYDSYFGEGKGTGRWGTNYVVISFETYTHWVQTGPHNFCREICMGGKLRLFIELTLTQLLTLWRMLSSKQSQLIICLRCTNVTQVSSLLHLAKTANIFFHFSNSITLQLKTLKLPHKTHLRSSIYPSSTWINSSQQTRRKSENYTNQPTFSLIKIHVNQIVDKYGYGKVLQCPKQNIF